RFIVADSRRNNPCSVLYPNPVQDSVPNIGAAHATYHEGCRCLLRSRAAGMNAAERPLAYKESMCEESHVIADADRRSCPGSSATCRAAAELRSASRRVRLPIPRQAPRILVATATIVHGIHGCATGRQGQRPHGAAHAWQ